MTASIPAPIDMVELTSRKDRAVESGITRHSWEELTRLLTHHDIRPGKDGACFMPARMKPREEWVLSKPRPGALTKPGYRNDANIEAVTMVVLDLDKAGAREKAESAFSDLEYVLYSTYSHSAETPYKYRIVMPVTEPIPVEDWPVVFRGLAHRVGADLQCSNVSRIFFYPSANPHAGIGPTARHHRGRILDAKRLVEVLKAREAVEAKAAPALSPSAMNAFSPRQYPARRRAPHFAGEGYLPNPNNYRLELIERRHQRSIEQLRQDDSRHRFAMTVIAREIARFGPRTDLPKLLQFLFYATKKYATRGMDSGNTIEEIPELVLSAWGKFGLRGSRELPAEAISHAITDAINDAFEAQRSGRWDFTDAPGAPPVLVVDAPADDPIDYARNVVATGLERVGPGVRLADLARNCVDNLCTSGNHRSLISTLTEAADRIRPEHGPWSEEQFRRFWRGALARAVAQPTTPEPGR